MKQMNMTKSLNSLALKFYRPKKPSLSQGLEMDYVKNGLNEGLNLTTQIKKGECGCGESFTV